MRTRKAFVAFCVVASASSAALAQLSITANTAQTQNFNSLATIVGQSHSPTGGIFAEGWSFLEKGSLANSTYAASTGLDNVVNTYSFGATGIGPLSDRAFGILQGSSLTSILGFTFVNDTGAPVNRIVVAYTGENWRRTTSTDTLAFSYQAGTPALDAMLDWTSVSSLNYTTTSTGTAMAVDGNSAPHRLVKSPVAINRLSIGNGSAFTLRWLDVTGYNSAGLAIDDFSITLLTVRGNHWVGSDSTAGGAGTWTENAGSSWAETDSNAAGYFWDPSRTANFAGESGGTVAVDGTVHANAGLSFSATGYALTGGTVHLGGAAPAINAIHVIAAATATIDSTLTGSAGLTKTGAGTLVLHRSPSYDGTTRVAEGTLALRSSASLANSSIIEIDSDAELDVSAGPYTFPAGQTLQGNGTVRGDSRFLGTLSPGGSSAGALSIASATPSGSGSLALGDGLPGGDGATLHFDIDGARRGVPGGHDALNVQDVLVYDGALNLEFGDTFAAGSSFDLFDFSDADLNFDSVDISGSYAGSLTYNSLLGKWSALIGSMTFTFTNSNGVLSLTAAAVPEPLTAAGVILLSSRVLGRRSRVSL